MFISAQRAPSSASLAQVERREVIIRGTATRSRATWKGLCRCGAALVYTHPIPLGLRRLRGSAPDTRMDRVRSVASRRWAQRSSSRTELCEGKGVSPGDTECNRSSHLNVGLEAPIPKAS